jgi:hypothetical protein
MAYTSHGFHIPGSDKGTPEPTHKMRCGGTIMCPICKNEVAAFHAVATNKPLDPQTIARHLVMSWVEEHQPGDKFDVFIVNEGYILGNWKARLGTTRADGLFFEVTYDVNRKRTYFDVYRKIDHAEIPD